MPGETSAVNLQDNRVVAVDGIRAGDADRERAARLLREHCAAGRLGLMSWPPASRVCTRRPHGASWTLCSTTSRTSPNKPASPRPASGAPASPFSMSSATSSRRHQRHTKTRCASSSPGWRWRVSNSSRTFRRDGLLSVHPAGLFVGVLLHPAADGGTVLAAFGEASRKVRKAFATLQD